MRFRCVLPIFRYFSHPKPFKFLRNFQVFLFKNSRVYRTNNIFQRSLSCKSLIIVHLFFSDLSFKSSSRHFSDKATSNLRFRFQDARYSFLLPPIFSLEYFVEPGEIPVNTRINCRYALSTSQRSIPLGISARAQKSSSILTVAIGTR